VKVTLQLLPLSLLIAMTASVAAADTITHGATTISMDFVDVGNTSNTADSTGYGAVDYRYRIGKYEVKASDWQAVVAADPNVGNAGNWSGSQPTGGASWNEAAMFCNWLTTGSATSGYYTISGGSASIPAGVSHAQYAASLGKTAYFIPTENEWYKAAYHKNNGDTGGATNYWDYPTTSDTAPTDVLSGTTADTAVFDGDLVTPTAPANVDEAGGLSAYGTMGQGGNIYEWTETEGVWNTYVTRQLRGGAFSYLGGSQYLRATDPNAAFPTDDSLNYGFRVSSITVPEPCSLIMLAGIALTTLLYWWRKRV